MMKTQAAVVWGRDEAWEIVEVDLDEPREGELLVRFEATGLCHSDEHLRSGSVLPRYPMVGGHEGGGVVERVGPGVTRFAEGDHVVCSFMPSCGVCRWCRIGRPNLCDLGANLMVGSMLDGSYRFHGRGQDLGGMCMLGSFAGHAVISELSAVKIDDDLLLDVACLVGCGVPTGWGSAVYAADVQPGDTVVVYGAGGVGMNAVQGAAMAGAARVVVVDPVADKQKWAWGFGASDVVGTAAEAAAVVTDLTHGAMADKAILTIGTVEREHVSAAFDVVGKRGRVVVTGQNHVEARNIELPGFMLLSYEKQIVGTLFGSCRPHVDIPRLLALYKQGKLKLDELITRRYRLEDINDAFAEQARGGLIRGVVLHDH